MPGPIFTNLLLADEINRAPPKTQAALLEAMQERQVTTEGETRSLASPFVVLATQNPIEYEGTYPLPEAQLDRFTMRVSLGYPPLAEEARMLDEQTSEPPLDSLTPVADSADVLRLVEATSGRVSFDGRDITELPNRALRPLRRSMQIIYQDPYESLDPRMTVRDAVEEPMLIHGLGGSRADRRELVREAVARVELTPPDLFLERYPHELSGGQRQRVAIAASLVLEPELLVADEPVSMLDVSVRAGVLNLLDRLRQEGLGILMITHDLSTAARYAHRIAVMYLGRIVEIGPASEIVENPQHPYTKALLSVVPRRDPRDRQRPQVLTGEAPDATRIPSGCRFHPRCPVAIEECRAHDPELLRPRNAVSPDHRAACILA